jgi:hypothetical protein
MLRFLIASNTPIGKLRYPKDFAVNDFSATSSGIFYRIFRLIGRGEQFRAVFRIRIDAAK